MDIVKLPPGERAPKDSDCISIVLTTTGTYSLDGSALQSCGDGDEIESVTMIGSKPYDSYEEAEAAGLAWAAEHCVGQVYVSTVA